LWRKCSRNSRRLSTGAGIEISDQLLNLRANRDATIIEDISWSHPVAAIERSIGIVVNREIGTT
jgi:hypothetical protein